MHASDNAFDAHLDACERCRTQPFNLCDPGAGLLAAAAERTGGAGIAPTMPAGPPEQDDDDEGDPDVPTCELCGDEFTIARGDREGARFCDPCAQEHTAKMLPREDECRRGAVPECVHCGHKWKHSDEVFEPEALNDEGGGETRAACAGCDRMVTIKRIVRVFYEVTP